MELTLESAFSTGGLIGHLSYFFLITSMMMRTLLALRILVIASASIAIAYAAIWLQDPVSTFWETLLVLVNIIQITIEWLKNRSAKFSPEETQFVKERLHALSPAEARQVLSLGVWADGVVGTELAKQGTPVTHLAYLSTGQVEITFDAKKVGVCLPGNYVGEMSVLAGGPASATATVSETSRYWLISADQLRKLHSKAPKIAAALELGMAKDMRHKIIAANRHNSTT